MASFLNGRAVASALMNRTSLLKIDVTSASVEMEAEEVLIGRMWCMRIMKMMKKRIR